MAHAKKLICRSAAFMAMLLWVGWIGGCEPTIQNNKLSLEIAGQAFELELAITPKQRLQGLSDRAHIADDSGMLFVFPNAQIRRFVMRRCPTPIDAVFLDGTGRVVRIAEMQPEPMDTPEAELKKYSSGYPTTYVIELRGGRARELELQVGQKLDLPLEQLKALAQ